MPDTLCSNLNIGNLETYVTNPIVGGVFSGPGVLENNGIYAFDATIAGIGSHTITYADATGCFTTTDTIIVNACLPALPPYISQTYAFDGTNQFIEIKNKDNTTPIAPGMYYLALYQNGAPTSAAHRA